MLSLAKLGTLPVVPLAHQELDDWRGQAAVFDDIFLVFLILGTLVGVVVISYMLYNAYKYREGATPASEFDAPRMGELPTGGSGGRKLFLSFAISAIIVIGLVAWTYTALLYVEQGAEQDVETEYDLEIVGSRFIWQVTYPNGETASTFEPNDDEDFIAVPEDTMVGLELSSNDVWHTFGISELRLKSDAIPGQTSETWLMLEDPEQENYHIECFELCGAGHSEMQGTLKVMDQDEWEAQYVENTSAENGTANDSNTSSIEVAT